MALGQRFVCSHCCRFVDVWDEGNPYYLDETGEKRYAYHPEPYRDRCTGNDAPYICLSCGEKFVVDSESSFANCPKCFSALITPTVNLNNKLCPYCKRGTFQLDLNFSRIS
jgi:hypothetical protein